MLQVAENKKDIVKLFDYQSKELRTLTDLNNNVWFSGKDVATILDYNNTCQAIRKNVNDIDKITFGTLIRLTRGGATNSAIQNIDNQAILINESGLYDLIFGSKKQEAKAFRRWVTNDVIPTIRKTGSYSVNQTQQCTDQQIKLKEIELEHANLLNERNKLDITRLNLYKQIKNECSTTQYKRYMEQFIINHITASDHNNNTKAITYQDPESYMNVGVVQLAVDEGFSPTDAQKYGISIGRYVSKKFKQKYPNEKIDKGRKIFAANNAVIRPNTYKHKHKPDIICWIKEYFDNKKENKKNKKKQK